MNIIKPAIRTLSAIVLMCCLAACGSENTSSSSTSMDSASTTTISADNAFTDTTGTGAPGSMEPATENAGAAGTNGTSTNGSSAAPNSRDNPQGSSGGEATNNAGLITDGQVGPHATTVLRGEKTGVTPQGVKKARDYIKKDSINNRTGLAPVQ